MKALKLDNRRLALIELDNGTADKEYESLRSEIGGYIELVRLGRDAAMVVDEEGLLKGLWQNPLASLIAGQMIVGPALIVGMECSPDGDICTDVPHRFIEKFAVMIHAEHTEKDRAAQG